jgi:hypothetical protein
VKRGLKAPARCLAVLLLRPATSRDNDAMRATLFAADRVPCTLVADDAVKGFAGTVDGLSVLRKLTAQGRANVGARRKEWRLLLDTMELHEHFALFWA